MMNWNDRTKIYDRKEMKELVKELQNEGKSLAITSDGRLTQVYEMEDVDHRLAGARLPEYEYYYLCRDSASARRFRDELRKIRDRRN